MTTSPSLEKTGRDLPAVGSEWLARDGRRMRVDEVVIPTFPDDLPWCKMTVLNGGKRTRRNTTMSIGNFGSPTHFGFLRPATTKTEDAGK